MKTRTKTERPYAGDLDLEAFTDLVARAVSGSGDGEDAFEIGDYFLDRSSGDDVFISAGIRFMEIGAGFGHARAATEAGKAIAAHPHCSREDGFDWMAKAAERNDPEGTFLLGIMFRDGLGVETNGNRANELFAKAKGLGFGADPADYDEESFPYEKR